MTFSIIQQTLIIASLMGLIFVLLGIHLSASVVLAMEKIGNAGSVMTLIALGASIQFQGMRKNLRSLIFGTLLRLVVTPLCALIAAVLIGFRESALGIVLICTTTPLASNSYPMALACDSDYELTGQLVVMTSLFCFLTIFLWIFLLKQLGYI